MTSLDSFRSQLLDITENDFPAFALELFDYQYHQNDVYRNYCEALGRSPNDVRQLDQIPFLPIEFFKTKEIQSGTWDAKHHFLSSGTTGSVRSLKLVKDLDFYHQVTESCFEFAYGTGLENITVIGLFPRTIQHNESSSLISMVRHFIATSGPDSGFCETLDEAIEMMSKNEKDKNFLIGLTYFILQLAETPKNLPDNSFVVETGGMKGNRREMVREDLHAELSASLQIAQVHSEYGMTELTSQMYSTGKGYFKYPPWVKILTREINDPFTYVEEKLGGINIIDLANMDTCAFIETKDLGTIDAKNGFYVLGRIDNSDIRGCNLLL